MNPQGCFCMCTALSLTTEDHYFGRTLDLEYTLHESVIIAPRRFPFPFRHLPSMPEHLAVIGAGVIRSGYPLYYDACNEAGLAVAGLNFPGFAQYHPAVAGKDNAASFEIIPWILGSCRTVDEAKARLQNAVVCHDAFSPEYPPSPLHFMISDAQASIVAEPLESSLRIHDNPIGVMTNSPPFEYHLTRLRDFAALSPDAPENVFAPALDLAPYSRGMGAMGLPGDWSSVSRLIRAAFLRAHSVCAADEGASVAQFFRILAAVSHVRGSVLADGRHEITQYASCCHTKKGVYYYTTYENPNLTAVDMRHENLDGSKLIEYPMITQPTVRIQNAR